MTHDQLEAGFSIGCTVRPTMRTKEHDVVLGAVLVLTTNTGNGWRDHSVTVRWQGSDGTIHSDLREHNPIELVRVYP